MRFTILGLSCKVYSMTYCLSKRVEEFKPEETVGCFFRLCASMFSYRNSGVQEAFDTKHSFSLQKEELSWLASIY